MSPRRAGSPAARAVVVDPVCHRPALATAARTAPTTSSASRSRSGPAAIFAVVLTGRGGRPAGPTGGRRAHGVPGATYSGCDVVDAQRRSDAEDVALTHSMTGASCGSSVVSRQPAPRRSGRGRRGTSRCRPAGTGRSTASDRPRRRGGPARPATVRPRLSTAALGSDDGQQHGQLDLDRIGVLELVEQQARVALAETLTHLHPRWGSRTTVGPGRGGRGTPDDPAASLLASASVKRAISAAMRRPAPTAMASSTSSTLSAIRARSSRRSSMSTPPFFQFGFVPTFFQIVASESRRSISNSSGAAFTRAHPSTSPSRCSTILSSGTAQESAHHRELRDVRDQRGQIHRRGIGFLAVHAFLDEIPVGVELCRHVAVALHLHPGRQRQQKSGARSSDPPEAGRGSASSGRRSRPGRRSRRGLRHREAGRPLSGAP